MPRLPRLLFWRRTSPAPPSPRLTGREKRAIKRTARLAKRDARIAARAAKRAPSNILPPYTDDLNSFKHRRRGRWLVGGMIAFCWFQGLVFAFFAPYLLTFFAFLIGLIMWPNYLALTLPGMPWITIARLTGVPLGLVFVICLSVSPAFRTLLASELDAVPLVWKAMIVFVILQFISIGFSKTAAFSVERFLTAQTSWTAVFFVSVYILSRPGGIMLWVKILCSMVIPIGLIAVVEARHSQVPWANHIPSFLQIQDPLVLAMLHGATRAGTGAYRAQSTFTSPIALGEYFAYTFPFTIHILTSNFKRWMRIVSLLTLPLYFYVAILTHARTGWVGFLITALMYNLYRAYLNWRRSGHSLVSSFIVFAYPVLAGVALLSTVVVGHIKHLVWGGGETQFSNLARQQQYHSGIPKVLSHPWGYGIGRAGETLGFFLPGGMLTIDTYYLVIALEYGIVGFIVYFGMFMWAIGVGALRAIADDRRELEYTFMAPAVIALTNFVVIKSVFSQTDNHPLAFMLLGMVVALVYRMNTDPSPMSSPSRQPAIQAGTPRSPRSPASQPAAA